MGSEKRARLPPRSRLAEAADRGSATSRQILRVERTCHRQSRDGRVWPTPVISRIEIPHRSAGSLPIEMCYLLVRSTEALGSEAARVHHAAPRHIGGVAARGARAAGRADAAPWS